MDTLMDGERRSHSPIKIQHPIAEKNETSSGEDKTKNEMRLRAHSDRCFLAPREAHLVGRRSYD